VLELSVTPSLGAQNIEEGFEHYDEMCTTCHCGPGIERSEIGKGLNPRAPDLAKAIKAWAPRQLFWIVKHGVKMTGMPSFSVTHNDEQIWSIVAFIEKLPDMSPEQYQHMRQQPSRPRSHEDLMDMKH
jgi:mono/diheme cytochrome c family protein